VSAGAMIATSINMHVDTLGLISRGAAKLDISKRALIVRLLMRIMRDVGRFQRGFSTVKYQPDDNDGRWHCFSIRFKPDENEFFTDLRNFCKCSVSLLVAIAAEKYLAEILGENENEVYNNALFRNYNVRKEVTDGIIYWIISWGRGKNSKTRQRE
jgi:hypothetical protein